MSQKARWTLTLADDGVAGDPPAVIRLRAALKRLWRGYRLRCTSIWEGDLMTMRELADLGVRMRTAQATYFRTCAPADREAARLLENDFDAACDEALDPKPGLSDGPEVAGPDLGGEGGGA